MQSAKNADFFKKYLKKEIPKNRRKKNQYNSDRRKHCRIITQTAR